LYPHRCWGRGTPPSWALGTPAHQDRGHEAGCRGQRVELLPGQPGCEAAGDVVVLVDDPAVLGQEQPVVPDFLSSAEASTWPS